jgi:hypothetical protein
MSDRTLTAADDRLHQPAVDDPWWTETAWFGFAHPPTGLCGSIYQIYRTVQGVMATAVYVWRPGRESLHELPYYRAFWHLPIPDGAHPCDNELPSGLSIESVDPMRAYRLRYRDPGELELDLEWTAVIAAQPFHVANGMGHLDQLGRVTGTLTLHGETLVVDCIEMRDRSWTPRRETSSRTRRGYCYGATADGRDGFFAATNVPPGSTDDVVVGGWLLRSGEVIPVDGGRRLVHRDDRHRPVAVDLELTVDGAEHRFDGRVASRLALPTTPYFAWMSLTGWTGADGRLLVGEDHDSWSPRRWRALQNGEEA